MSTPSSQVIVSTSEINVVEVITPGPQGPTGPMGNPGSGGGGGTQTLGQLTPSLRINFNTWMAANASAYQIADYTFGTSAVTGPGKTPITNLTQLAQYFNAFEDFTELTSINSEIERYQPFNSANHVLNPTNLTIQAVNPNNDWQCTAVTQIAGAVNLNNTPTAIANLGLANTSSVQVGQMCGIQGGGGVGGAYWITAIVPNTSVTLQALNGAPTSPVSGGSTGLIFWLPIYGATLSSPYNVGGPSFTFSSLPAGVTSNMALGVYNEPSSGTTLYRDADYRVTSIVGNVVSFSPAWVNLGNLGVGTIIWFLPAVTAGQIWSKSQFDLTNPQTFFALQVDANIFNSSTTLTALGNDGQLTLAQFNALPASTAFGAWAAIWMYSANDGNSAAETSSVSEMDCVEIQYGCTQDITSMNSGNAGFSTQAILLGKNDSGWSYSSAFGISRSPPGTTFVGRNLYQFIFCNGRTYRFFNGVLYNVKTFQWTNQRPAQFGIDIAAGGLTAALVMNTIFPNNPAGFSNMQVAINEIKVWYQAAPGG